MSMEKKIIAKAFMEMAEGLESGSFGVKPRIALTGMGSEHGEENAMQAAVMAAARGVDVYYIGSLEHEGITTIHVADDEEGHKMMEEMVEKGEVDGAVTMHFPFPIGVSTVGRVVTPAKGKEMFVANTTGTSSADRIEGMIKNAVYGIIAAKACGVKEPTLGILNVDGARQTEMALKELQKNGYDFKFAESARADGGAVMRGNDVLQGTPDVMVMDSLTGNVMVKMLSSFTTGGSFESTGYGYGPGIGRDYDKLVLIISRASGAPLIANALSFADELVRGGVQKIAKAEFALADKAGLEELFRRVRERIPGVVLRTSLITGLPGEGEAELEELCVFLRETKIERAGVFPFSPEEGTRAARMDHVDMEEARRRAELVVDVQSDIIDAYNESVLGTEREVLCEGFDSAEGCYTGRTYADSPDIDGRVLFTAAGVIPAGTFVNVRITGMSDGDLTGEIEE